MTAIIGGLWKNRLTETTPNNPLMWNSIRFHSFARALLPNLGIAQVGKAIPNISAKTESIANFTADALGRLQTEINSPKEAVFQNGMVLDMVKAQMGGVCTLINSSCYTHIDQSGRIAMDIHSIWRHAKYSLK